MALFTTSTDIYKYFLDGIRKYGVGSVPPERFNRLINEAQINWMKSKCPVITVGQKRIDDLKAILIELTESILYRGCTGWVSTSYQGFHLPNGTLYSNAKRYWRTAGLRVKTQTGTDWIQMVYEDSLRKTVIQKDPYDIPDTEQGKYRIIGDYVKMNIGTNNNIYYAQFEYYGYPTKIEYNGTGNPKGDFEDEQLFEIVDMAVQIHLERIESRRFPTFAAEDTSKPK